MHGVVELKRERERGGFMGIYEYTIDDWIALLNMTRKVYRSIEEGEGERERVFMSIK